MEDFQGMIPQFKTRWDNYLQNNGKVWPAYEFVVLPRNFNAKEQHIEFTSLVPVGKDRLCPVVETYTMVGLTIEHITEIYKRYTEKVDLILEHFISTEENTIQDIRIFKPQY